MPPKSLPPPVLIDFVATLNLESEVAPYAEGPFRAKLDKLDKEEVARVSGVGCGWAALEKKRMEALYASDRDVRDVSYLQRGERQGSGTRRAQLDRLGLDVQGKRNLEGGLENFDRLTVSILVAQPPSGQPAVSPWALAAETTPSTKEGMLRLGLATVWPLLAAEAPEDRLRLLNGPLEELALKFASHGNATLEIERRTQVGANTKIDIRC
ncbi:hypothetical protein BDK51DRAFT_45542 [Blyttiomyces helicus]|uniref:Uncharacterized protein n=1 Tax=Blyttiomyces helicus TaxID=388810 RepID=A0A4P9W059_9FUNG|nr:hypothetical protein BDK51DRAFT_45542 [Blyttiomyces helicus]|eukprot:RKO83930.1 hypothetical protein BDK51DRAFT_45542 [Blyttiomyces helicus]